MADLAKKTAARELGVSERTIDRLRNQGEITWHLVGSKVVIAEESIAAFRERHKTRRRPCSESGTTASSSGRQGATV
jgi:excisionase family DNA binding protein